MIELARQTYPNLWFAVGSMTALDLRDDTLGGILAYFSTHHTPPEWLPVIFAEFRRTLAPGGYLMLGGQPRPITIARSWDGLGVSAETLREQRALSRAVSPAEIFFRWGNADINPRPAPGRLSSGAALSSGHLGPPAGFRSNARTCRDEVAELCSAEQQVDGYVVVRDLFIPPTQCLAGKQPGRGCAPLMSSSPTCGRRSGPTRPQPLSVWSAGDDDGPVRGGRSEAGQVVRITGQDPVSGLGQQDD